MHELNKHASKELLHQDQLRRLRLLPREGLLRQDLLQRPLQAKFAAWAGLRLDIQFSLFLKVRVRDFNMAQP